MSIDTLKEELAHLGDGERRQIIVYLLSLQDQDEVYREELARRRDEQDPGKWFTLEQLDQRLGIVGQ